MWVCYFFVWIMVTWMLNLWRTQSNERSKVESWNIFWKFQTNLKNRERRVLVLRKVFNDPFFESSTHQFLERMCRGEHTWQHQEGKLNFPLISAFNFVTHTLGLNWSEVEGLFSLPRLVRDRNFHNLNFWNSLACRNVI